jgi:hypothetical protein
MALTLRKKAIIGYLSNHFTDAKGAPLSLLSLELLLADSGIVPDLSVNVYVQSEEVAKKLVGKIKRNPSSG